MRVKAVNREPVIRPEGTLALQDREEVSLTISPSPQELGVEGNSW
jgi:hypothetical protein